MGIGRVNVPEGYRLERGLLWPATDIGAAAAVFTTLGDLDVAYRYCRGFDVAVQAGGNCGVWPAAMGEKFRVVYTFEPDPINFRCLCANAPAVNVFKFCAALGMLHHAVDLDLRPDNVGAHQVDGEGDIPTFRIDDLGLRACDLICLDIEGYELRALHGARSTIRQFRPVIMVEDKGMSERYGVAKGEAEKWICEQFGYRVAERPHRDVVMVP
jgi:FkbM family methyltransferase